MISAAARNRRMSASPTVRSTLALAVGALANSPAPMVPAPTASEVPKKERRLIELLKGFALSSKLSSRVSTLFMVGSFTFGFDVDVVNNDAGAQVTLHSTRVSPHISERGGERTYDCGLRSLGC